MLRAFYTDELFDNPTEATEDETRAPLPPGYRRGSPDEFKRMMGGGTSTSGAVLRSVPAEAS